MAHLCFNKMRCPKHSAAAKAAFLSKLQQRLHFQTGMAVYREKKKKKNSHLFEFLLFNSFHLHRGCRKSARRKENLQCTFSKECRV